MQPLSIIILKFNHFELIILSDSPLSKIVNMPKVQDAIVSVEVENLAHRFEERKQRIYVGHLNEMADYVLGRLNVTNFALQNYELTYHRYNEKVFHGWALTVHFL